MSALAVSLCVFGCVFAGALAGFALRRNLPEHHFSQDSKNVVQLGTGLIATMAALVLGLLTASAKDKFDLQSDEVKQTAANIVLLDRALARYGPEAQDLREAPARQRGGAGRRPGTGDPARSKPVRRRRPKRCRKESARWSRTTTLRPR